MAGTRFLSSVGWWGFRGPQELSVLEGAVLVCCWAGGGVSWAPLPSRNGGVGRIPGTQHSSRISVKVPRKPSLPYYEASFLWLFECLSFVYLLICAFVRPAWLKRRPSFWWESSCGWPGLPRTPSRSWAVCVWKVVGGQWVSVWNQQDFRPCDMQPGIKILPILFLWNSLCLLKNMLNLIFDRQLVNFCDKNSLSFWLKIFLYV